MIKEFTILCVTLSLVSCAAAEQKKTLSPSNEIQTISSDIVAPEKKSEAESLIDNLDGKEYCRSGKSEAYPGGPIVEKNHCVSFVSGKMTDNANSFFGNPPESLNYRLRQNKIEVKRDGKWFTEYLLTGTTIESEDGLVVLTNT